MLHAIRTLLGEGGVRAALLRRNRRIGGAEIAHVQLVQHDVLGRSQPWFDQCPPAARLQLGVIERDDVAADAVARQGNRVRIGDDVGLDLVGAAHVDLGLVLVVLAVEVGAAVAPDAARRIQRHRVSRERGGRIRVGEHAHLHVASGRRPDAQCRLSMLDARAERDRRGTGGIQSIENPGYLQPGGVDTLHGAHRTHGQLTFQALGGGRDCVGWQLERGQVREVRKLRAQRSAEARRIVRERP